MASETYVRTQIVKCNRRQDKPQKLTLRRSELDTFMACGTKSYQIYANSLAGDELMQSSQINLRQTFDGTNYGTLTRRRSLNKFICTSGELPPTICPEPSHETYQINNTRILASFRCQMYQALPDKE
jgi:hypothetical protein